MSTNAIKPDGNSISEADTSSGWDPFTVWRERVHKPRAKVPAARPGTSVDERPLAVLEPVKQGS
jgi:hypothetical protein